MALRGRSKYLIFWSPKGRETGREGEKRKREEGIRRRGRGEEEEEEKKSKQSQAPKRYGTSNLEYGAWIFGMDPWFCLVNGLP